MIVIRLPIKALKEDTQKERDRVEENVYRVCDEWREKNPSFEDKSIDLLWGSYYDIQGRGLPDGSPQRIELFKAIKAIL